VLHMCGFYSKKKVIGMSNTSIFIVDRIRLHVLTLIGSSSSLFEAHARVDITRKDGARPTLFPT